MWKWFRGCMFGDVGFGCCNDSFVVCCAVSSLRIFLYLSFYGYNPPLFLDWTAYVIYNFVILSSVVSQPTLQESFYNMIILHVAYLPLFMCILEFLRLFNLALLYFKVLFKTVDMKQPTDPYLKKTLYWQGW